MIYNIHAHQNLKGPHRLRVKRFLIKQEMQKSMSLSKCSCLTGSELGRAQISHLNIGERHFEKLWSSPILSIEKQILASCRFLTPLLLLMSENFAFSVEIREIII